MGPDGQITALAVGLGHLVPPDTISIRRRVDTSSGSLTYELPVAGLASWLCLKSDAIMRRDKAKDAHDVIWTLDALGPDVASRRVAASPMLSSGLADELVTQLRQLVDDQFQDAGSVGPIAYRAFFEDGHGGDERRHALGTVRTFGRALRTNGVI